MVNMRVINVICLGTVTVHTTKYGVLRRHELHNFKHWVEVSA